jgi:hypothetical protein
MCKWRDWMLTSCFHSVQRQQLKWAAFFTAWTHRILLVLIYSQFGTSAAWRGWIAGSYNVGGDLRTDPGVSSASQATRVVSLQWYCSGRDSQTSLCRPGKARRDETWGFEPVIRDVQVTVVTTRTAPRVLEEWRLQSSVPQSLWPVISRTWISMWKSGNGMTTRNNNFYYLSAWFFFNNMIGIFYKIRKWWK